MPKDILKEFKKWSKDNVVKDPVQDLKKFELYCKIITLTKLVFGEENFKADNPNIELKTHVITVRVQDMILNKIEEKEKMAALAYIIENVDFFNISPAMNGETVMIDYAVDNVYHERK